MRSLSVLTDDELVQLMIIGNNHAFGALISRHQSKIFSSIYYKMGDKSIAEDIMQDTVIKIHHSIIKGGYRAQGKFLPWAIKIAQNLCHDHFRNLKSNLPLLKTDPEKIFGTGRLREESQESKMIQHQNKQYLIQLVNALPKEQRQVIISRHYEDLSFKEIAQKTNCSINTAIGRMRYALNNLRKMAEQQHLYLQ